MRDIRDRRKPRTACPIHGIEAGGRRDTYVVHGHSAGFGASELREYDADADILYEGGIEVGVCGEGGAEDGREEFFWIGIFEVAFVGAGYGGTEGGEDDDVGGVFFEDVGEAFADGA